MEPAGEHFLPAAGALTGSRPAVEIARKGQVGTAGLRVLGDLIDVPAGGEGPVHLGIAGGRGDAYAAGGDTLRRGLILPEEIGRLGSLRRGAVVGAVLLPEGIVAGVPILPETGSAVAVGEEDLVIPQLPVRLEGVEAPARLIDLDDISRPRRGGCRGQSGDQGPDGPGGSVAVHHRHLHIHEDRGIGPRGLGGEALHRGLAVFGHIQGDALLPENFHGDHGVDLVVLGHEDPAGELLGCRSGFRLGGLGLVGHGEGKDHREVGALTLHALHHDLPAHEPDQLVGDGHSQARSAKAAGGAGVLLLKGTENAVDELGIHADAGVVDPEHQIQRPLPQEHLAEGDGDLPLAGEFHRVGKEVDDHLANSQLAAHHPVRRHAIEPDIAADVLDVQGLGKHIAELAAKGPQAEGLGFQLHLARLDAGHIENVVDETEKKLAEHEPIHRGNGGEPLPAAALPRPPSQQKEGGDELGTAHQDQAIEPAQSGEKLGQRIHRAPPFF